MRIVNLSFQDFAGAAYTLSHAINKCSKHQAINLRSTNNYLNYPAIAQMRDYDAQLCRKMIYAADVIVFHSAVRPFYEGLNLQPAKLKEKKKLLYLHGSELRAVGKQLEEQAEIWMGNYQIVVSTPDLLLISPEDAKWLPVARSFSEIRRRYRVDRRDRKALESFGVPKKNVTLCHATTSEQKRGSNLFYKVATEVIKSLPYVNFLSIQRQPWDSCLRLLSTVDVYFDMNPSFVSAYGMSAVEVSMFKAAIINKMTSEVIAIMKREYDLDSPFITFTGEKDLTDKVFRLAEDPSLRSMFGQMAYKYCKTVHDEKPVTQRFLEIIEEMP